MRKRRDPLILTTVIVAISFVLACLIVTLFHH